MSEGEAEIPPLARLRAELAAPPFHGFLRPEPVSADREAGTVVVRLPYRPDLRRSAQEPFFHGGVVAALIDLVGHAAVAIVVGRMVPTVDLRIDFMRPAAGEALLATGRVRRVGRSMGIADIEIKGGDGRVVALGRGTFSTRTTQQR